MAKVLAVLDVNATHFTVRMDDGSVVFVEHPNVPHVGEELPPQGNPATLAPSLMQMNSREQVQANILSEMAQPHGDDEPPPNDPEPAKFGKKSNGSK